MQIAHTAITKAILSRGTFTRWKNVDGTAVHPSLWVRFSSTPVLERRFIWKLRGFQQAAKIADALNTRME